MISSNTAYHWPHPRIDESWKDQATCRDEDPGLWFPAPDDRRRYDQEVRALTLTAKAICLQCPVRIECLEYALDIDAQHGIWGGMTESERNMLRRRR